MLELIQVPPVALNLRPRPLDQPGVVPGEVVDVPRASDELLVDDADVRAHVLDVLQVEHRRIDVPPVGDDGRVLLGRRERVHRVVIGDVVALLASDPEVQQEGSDPGEPDRVPPSPDPLGEVVESDHAERRQRDEAGQIV